MNPLMQAALEYEKAGLSIIPIKVKDKIPLLPSWLEFQAVRAAREQIGKWWRLWNNANIGIITGAVSGIVVIDTDSHDAAHNLRPLLGDLSKNAIVTTGKGFHIYYKHTGKILHNRAGIQPHVDFRGDGGYVVAPPSIHNSGKYYEWVRPLRDDMPYLPAAFEKLLTVPVIDGFRERFDTAKALTGLPEGQRDQGLFKLACKLRGADIPYETALELCEQAAANCVPPFREAKRKVDQAYKYSAGHGIAVKQPEFWPELINMNKFATMPLDPKRWIWHDCLPARSTSALIAKPYIGKTTFACSLAIAVARGIEFLGRPTTKGNVAYIYLDGSIDEFRDVLEKLGALASDSIFIHVGAKPDRVIEWLEQRCSEHEINLVIIDTAQKFFGFKEDRYEEKINKMQPMLDLVNKSNMHAMFTYHAAKNSLDTISALGSVATEANARVSLYLRKLPESGERRIFDTQQNTGKSFAEMGLSNPEDGFLVKIGSLEEVQVQEMTKKVYQVIQQNAPITETDLKNGIEGRGRIIGMALRELKKQERIEWSGTGRRGDAKKYYPAGSLIKENEEPKSKIIELFPQKEK